jgi:hypothetical protein
MFWLAVWISIRNRVGICDRYFIDENGKNLCRMNTPEYNSFLLFHANLVQCCFLYRRACYEHVGAYDSDYLYAEDWEYWIRISLYFRLKHIPEALYCYRLHRNSLTTDILKSEKQEIAFNNFSSRLRKHYPFRWYLGKFIWRWIKLTSNNHPAVLEHKHCLKLAP